MEIPPPILLVEDNEDDAYFIGKAFHSLGLHLEIRHCRDGKTAIDYLHTHVVPDQDQSGPPQLVVLDLKMPGKSGFEVLEWIRAQKFSKQIVVVILTSSTSERDNEKAEELNVNAYWMKPVGLNDMRDVARCICHLWLHHTPGMPQKSEFEDVF